MTGSFENDRKAIERKYHDPLAPFDSYKRMAYHGWEADESTGKTIDEIKAGLNVVAERYADAPHPIAKARAVEYVLDNTRVDIRDEDYFPLIYTWGRETAEHTCEKWRNEVFTEKIPGIKPDYDLLNASGASNMWPDFDHVIPDWDAVLSLGFTGLLARAKEYRGKLLFSQGALNVEQTAFFDGIEIEYAAIVRFVRRLYDLSLTRRGEKSSRISSALRSISQGAPQDIYEAMLVMYLYFMISESIDCYQVRSLGNGLDHTLFRFYEADLGSGRYTRDEIKELLGYFLLQWSAIGNYWGQPLYLGGTDEEGKCKINALSYDIIDVYSRLGIYNPKIQIKYSPLVPRDFLYKILSSIRQNVGSYVFCCEKGMIKAIRSYGATEKEARSYDIRGCYETGVRANEVSAVSAYVNVLKAVEYVFSDGFDVRLGKQVGVKTGKTETLTTFEDFYAAFIAQWSFLIEKSISIADEFEKYLGYMNPSNMYSATVKGGMQKGVDAYQSGVKYNNSALLCCGFASAVDSLEAVKYLVFDTKTVSLSALKEALDNDWEGSEKLRLTAQKFAPKYGNGNKEADETAAALARYFTLKVANRPNSRGGVYKPIMHSAMQFVWQGAKTAATPDGRKSGEEASKNASPSVGADRNGATALIKSALGLDPYTFTESFCLDVMLHPSAVEGDDGLAAIKGLLDVYYDGDGQSVQFNIFDSKMLRDAQAHPEKYANLQVRVCGWNVLWNNLSPAEQEAYIKRAENIA